MFVGRARSKLKHERGASHNSRSLDCSSHDESAKQPSFSRRRRDEFSFILNAVIKLTLFL